MVDEVIVIAGGTGAIGTAICREFSKQTDYTIIANCPKFDEERSLSVLQQLQEENCNVQLACFDVTNGPECQDAIETIEKTIGPLDGVFNVTRPCVSPMTERGYGRIINISSVNGQRGQIGQTNYSAAKAGMTGFTKALAREVARDGITVNSVSPGYVNSPMIEAIPDKVKEKLLKEIPVGRCAETFEIARAVAFLAHKDSGYITGTDLSVNGGYHIG